MDEDEEKEKKEKEVNKPNISSNDIANYGSALGNVFTGISSIISSTKNEKPTSNKNTSNRTTDKPTQDNSNGKNDNDEKTGYAWYIWVAAVAGAALFGWGIYKLILKKD